MCVFVRVRVCSVSVYVLSAIWLAVSEGVVWCQCQQCGMKGRCGRRLSWRCTVEAWTYNRSTEEVITLLCLPSPSLKDIHTTHARLHVYDVQHPSALLTICNFLRPYWQYATPSSLTDNMQHPPALLTICNTLQPYWQHATPSSLTDNMQYPPALLAICNILQPTGNMHCPSALLIIMI